MLSSWWGPGRCVPGARRSPAVGLIAATALVALLAMAIDARGMMVSAPSVPCNHGDRGPLWPTEVRAGTGEHLVPPGAVSLTVCGYNGVNADRIAPQFGLVSSGGSASRHLIDRIAAEVDGLKPAPGSHSCLLEQGSDEVVTFAYASGPPVVITVDTGGCGRIDNGRISRLALGAPIATQLEAMSTPVVGIDWPAVVGHLRLCGGPAPGGCHIENYKSGDRVVATDASGSLVAMAPVQHGRFHFRVATAGSLTFAFYTGNTLVKRLRTRVTSGQATSVVFAIPIY